jgi:hypothetical protein
MRRLLFTVVCLATTMSLADSLGAGTALAQSPGDWPIHSLTRPQPPVIDPGKAGPPVPAPSDAIVLFDGHSLDNWRATDSTGAPTSSSAKWKVEQGHMEVVAGTRNIATARGFGDVQLHVEWSAPVPAKGEGQERGNSGVFLMGTYEVQVLDSYHNTTYADGQASAIYGQFPPLVNASRPPGEWQTYDIVFHAPRFDPAGRLLRPARMTVLHNGVLVQDNVTLTGPTAHQRRPPYTAHPDRLPLILQDHGDPVRYRNIWVRELRSETP